MSSNTAQTVGVTNLLLPRGISPQSVSRQRFYELDEKILSYSPLFVNKLTWILFSFYKIEIICKKKLVIFHRNDFYGLCSLLVREVAKGTSPVPSAHPSAMCLTEILFYVEPFEKFSWCSRSVNFRINGTPRCTASPCFYTYFCFYCPQTIIVICTWNSLFPHLPIIHVIPPAHLLSARRHHACGVPAGLSYTSCSRLSRSETALNSKHQHSYVFHYVRVANRGESEGGFRPSQLRDSPPQGLLCSQQEKKHLNFHTSKQW